MVAGPFSLVWSSFGTTGPPHPFRWCRRPGQGKLIGWASEPAAEHRQIAQSWPVPSSSDAQAGSALVYRHQRYRLQPAPTNERLSHEMDWFTGSSQVHVTSRTARTLASRTRSSCAGRTARICSFTRTCTSWSNRAGSSCSSITCTRSAPNERRVGPGGGLHGSPPPTSNVEEVTMAAMAALGIRSGSLQFVRSGRSRCKRQVSANGSARARTPATPCHAEGRGFESHHPLLESPANPRLSVSVQVPG